MGTQKNRLNETVLLKSQNICYKLLVRKYLQVYADFFFVYLNLTGYAKIWRMPFKCIWYCKFGSFREGFIFAKHMRSFAKIKSSLNGEISLSFTDMGKSDLSRKFLTWQPCL